MNNKSDDLITEHEFKFWSLLYTIIALHRIKCLPIWKAYDRKFSAVISLSYSLIFIVVSKRTKISLT